MQGKPTEPLQCRMYNNSTIIYTSGQQIPLQRGCFAYMFTNIGDTTATINGMVIFPSATPTTSLGDSRSISGHDGDLYMGELTLRFDGANMGINPMVEVVQLFYILNN